MKHRHAAFATALGLAAALVGPSAHGAPDSVLSQFGDKLRIYHMYSGADGKTRIDEVELPSQAIPAFTSIFNVKTSSARLIYDHDGEVGGWHTSIPRHLTLIIRGTFQIDVGEGRIYPFPAGSILFAEDSKGLGHRTTCDAKEPGGLCMLLVTNLTGDEAVLPAAH